MGKKKKSNQAGKANPSVKVQDLELDQDPKGGTSPTLRPVKWEGPDFDAALNIKTR